MKTLLKEAIIIDRLFDQSLDELDHSKIVIHFYRKNHYLNSLFYENVKVIGAKVYGDNINENRKTLIGKLINSIYLDLTLSSIKESRLSYDLSRFIQFIRWCDSNKIHNCLDSDIQCIDAFITYVDYHWERVAAHKYKSSTTTNVLTSIKRILQNIILSQYHETLPMIDNRSNRELSTSPPDELTASENIQFLLSLFNGISEFLLEKKEYPYQLKVPSFLKVANDGFWLFPTKSWCQTDLAPNGTSKQKTNKGYNFGEGRVVTHKELIERREFIQSDRARIINKAHHSIAKFNRLSHSYQKNDLAITAMSSFAFLFIANTGMNPTQLLNILWDNVYSVEKETIDFRIIKHRANNKIVHFRITSNFISTFKRYLELRLYFLNGKTSEFLIPSFNSKYNNHLNLDFISNKIKTIMDKIKYDSSLITSREWRSMKAEWLIANTDPHVASKLLQNTENTISQHYSSGTYARQSEEMGNYLEQLSKIKNISDEPYLQKTPVGGCKQPNSPLSISDNKFIKTNCIQPEGCLFCANYLIHVDRKDLQKILSCKYSIEHTQSLAKTIDHWHLIYDPIIERIDEIIDQINIINPVLVAEVTADVYVSQSLDSYWSHKLQMLHVIGAI
ncbi:hypothetical protein ACSCX3_000871 [Enterobacter hormaechei]